MLPFRGNCLSDTFVHCAKVAEGIFTNSLHTATPLLSQIVFKFDLHRSTLPPQILPPKVSHPLLIWTSETFDGKCGRMVTRNSHNGELIGNHHAPSLCRIVPSLTAYDLPSQEWGSRMHPQWSMSPFANTKLRWPLFNHVYRWHVFCPCTCHDVNWQHSTTRKPPCHKETGRCCRCFMFKIGRHHLL